MEELSTVDVLTSSVVSLFTESRWRTMKEDDRVKYVSIFLETRLRRLSERARGAIITEVSQKLSQFLNNEGARDGRRSARA